MKKELPDATVRFANIDKEVKEVLKKFKESKNAVECCNSEVGQLCCMSEVSKGYMCKQDSLLVCNVGCGGPAGAADLRAKSVPTCTQPCFGLFLVNWSVGPSSLLHAFPRFPGSHEVP